MCPHACPLHVGYLMRVGLQNKFRTNFQVWEMCQECVRDWDKNVEGPETYPCFLAQWILVDKKKIEEQQDNLGTQ